MAIGVAAEKGSDDKDCLTLRTCIQTWWEGLIS